MLANKLAKSINLSCYSHIKAANKIVWLIICTKVEPKQHNYNCFTKGRNLNGTTRVVFESYVATDDARRSAIPPSCEVPSRRQTIKTPARQKDYYVF